MIKYALSEIKRDWFNVACNAFGIAMFAAMAYFVAFIAVFAWQYAPITCAINAFVISGFWFHGAYEKHQRRMREQDECKPAH